MLEWARSTKPDTMESLDDLSEKSIRVAEVGAHHEFVR